MVSDGKGNVNIIIDESGISEGERLAPSYLNRVFVEVVTGRNPQTGKTGRITAVKVLNIDGTIAVRGQSNCPERTSWFRLSGKEEKESFRTLSRRASAETPALLTVFHFFLFSGRKS